MRNYGGIFSFLSNRKSWVIISVLFVLAIILSTILLVQGQRNPSLEAALIPNAIQIENAQPGTAGWRVTKQATNQIQAYAGEPSINKGEDVHLYVSTVSPSYSISIYRLGYYHSVRAQ